MELEDGQWRISEPPDCADRPEVVVRAAVPAGLALLLRPLGHVAGPRAGLRAARPAVRLDAGQRAARRSVPRAGGHRAQLPAAAAALAGVRARLGRRRGPGRADQRHRRTTPMPAPAEAELLVSQLAWTLRQDPSIERFRVTIGGRPVQLPERRDRVQRRARPSSTRRTSPARAASSSACSTGRWSAAVRRTSNRSPDRSAQSDYGLRTVAPDLRAGPGRRGDRRAAPRCCSARSRTATRRSPR